MPTSTAAPSGRRDAEVVAKSAVGLDIGTHAVYVAEVTEGRQGPKLVNFGGLALPPGAVHEGEILDVDAVTNAIRRLFEETGIKEKRVHVGVSNQRVVVRQVDLPYMEDSELAQALRFQVQEYIPIPVEESELDYYKLEEITDDAETRMIRILLVAADKEMVANHVAVVTDAGLRPVSADLNAFAVLRAVVPDPETADTAEMLVDIGSGVTNIVIHERGLPRFVRILVLGGGDITEALEHGLGMGREEAEVAKIERGLGAGDEAGDIVDRRADDFVDEVRGSLDYNLPQPGSVSVGRVILCGGGSKLEGLPARVENALRIPVDRGRPMWHMTLGNVAYGPEDLAEVEPMLTTAIGLAIGGLE
jgi:type IV pilus assembly protein PilM